MKTTTARLFTRRWTLQARFLLAFFSVGILPLGLIGLSVATLDRRVIAEQSARELTGLAHGLANQLDAYLAGMLSDTQAIAALPDLVSMDPARQGALLRDLFHHYPAFARLSIFDLSGQLLASSHPGTLPSVAARESFRTAVGRGHQAWMLAGAFSTPQRSLLVMHTPMRDAERRVVGVLGAIVELENFSGVVGRMPVGEGGRAFVLDAAGRVLLHPDRAAVQERHDYSWFGVPTGGRPASAATVRYESEGEARVAGYAPLSNAGWTVVVERPETEVLAPAMRSWRLALAGLGTSAILAIVAAIVLARMLTRPVRQLIAATCAFGTGDATTPLPAITSGASELGTLVNAFAAMREAVARREEALGQAEAAARSAHQQTVQVLAAIPSILIGLDTDTRITWWNAAAERTFGLAAAEVVGQPLGTCEIPWDGSANLAALATCRNTGAPVRLDDVRFQRLGAKARFLEITLTPMQDTAGDDMGALLLGEDVTERKVLQSQLVQAQKLESIGQLAAGIAHEINTPTQYVGDNTRFLQEAFTDLARLLETYAAFLRAYKEGTAAEALVREVEATAAQIDVAYLTAEIPQAIQQSLEGIARVATIVHAMKEFSHPGTEEKTAIDLNRAVESTITIARNEWKYVAEMVTDFAPGLPPVPCLPGELNQVVLNIVINAAHAIADVVGNRTQGRGTITVSTRQDGDWAELRIADTGTGIPAAVRDRVFDPFFTTKEVGKGTGQGLAMAHTVVVEKHGGTITFETAEGRGTTFIIRLPLGAKAS